MKKIIIIGAGGNSKVIIDIILTRRDQLAEELQILGILDDDPDKKSLKGFAILGPIEKIKEYSMNHEVYFINGIGDNSRRKEIYEEYSNLQYQTIIHPSAIVGSGVSIGSGSVIMPGAIINTDSYIGRQVLINTGAIIEHDNVIEDFSHIASGVATAGNVRIGAVTMLGTGVRVIQGLKIGSRTMVGAGAVVISDIPDDCTAVGVPARIVKDSIKRK